MKLRRLVPRRVVAVAATGTLALGGLAVLTAPSASAGTVTPSVTCVLPAGQGTFTGPQDVTVTLDKSSVSQGGSLKGTVVLGESPAVSTITTTIWATPSITLAMRGAATGEVTITGPEVVMQVEAGKSPPLPPYEGRFSIPVDATVNGQIEFTVVKMVTDSRLAPGGGPGFPTVCAVGAGGDATVAQVDVEGSTGPDATLNAPDEEVHPGQPIPLTGTGFIPDSTPQVSLCDDDGSNCLASRFTENTLAVDGQGNLTGTAKLQGQGLATGLYVVNVAGGDKQATDTVNVTPYVAADPRAAQADPAMGPVGTTTTVTGQNWTPNITVTIVQTDASGTAGPGTISVPTDYRGAFSSPYTVSDPNAKQIRVREGLSSTKRVFIPFALVTVTPSDQDLMVALNAGPLSMTQAGSGIDFGTATLNGRAQQLTAPLNQVTVTDSRGGDAGWSLTGLMTDLTAANGTDKIPAGTMSWAPSCAALPGALSAVTSGSAGPLGSAATLCSQAADTKATGGRFTADAQITLTTPEFAAAGAYTGTLTLTLV